jgi:hypothetical protein
VDFAKTLRAELERARRAMVESRSRHDLIQQTLRKYEQLARTGASPAKAAEGAAKARTRRTVRAKTRSSTTTKSAVIRQIILDNHVSGVSVRDLIDALKRRRVKISKNAVFAALSKLKNRKLATKHNGKYFPEASMLGSEELRR